MWIGPVGVSQRNSQKNIFNQGGPSPGPTVERGGGQEQIRPGWLYPLVVKAVQIELDDDLGYVTEVRVSFRHAASLGPSGQSFPVPRAPVLRQFQLIGDEQRVVRKSVSGSQVDIENDSQNIGRR